MEHNTSCFDRGAKCAALAPLFQSGPCPTSLLDWNDTHVVTYPKALQQMNTANLLATLGHSGAMGVFVVWPRHSALLSQALQERFALTSE